jgi:hypothetical protein
MTDSLITKLITLPLSVHDSLRQVADTRDMPVSAVIRTAIDFYLSKGAPSKKLDGTFTSEV